MGQQLRLSQVASASRRAEREANKTAQRRLTKYRERPLHPNEEQALRERARQNVVDDVELLLDMSRRRAENNSKRIMYLGKCEHEYLSQLRDVLERIP